MMAEMSSRVKTHHVFALGFAAAFSCGLNSPALAEELDERHGSSAPAQAAPGSGEAQHDGGPAHGHHEAHFSDINWWTGMIGEKEGVEPGFLFRPPGTPVPLGALLLNTAILFFLIGKLGGPAISAGLVSRKERIAGEMQRAAKMKEEAEQQLAHYEGKLTEMNAEMARIKKQMREQAEHERARMMKEAELRASEIIAEANDMVAQQLSQARQDAAETAISAAVAAARAEIERSINSADQERLARDLFAGVENHFRRSEVAS